MKTRLFHLLLVGLCLTLPTLLHAQIGINPPPTVKPQQDVEIYTRNSLLIQQRYIPATAPSSTTTTMNCVSNPAALTAATGMLLDPSGPGTGNYPANLICSQNIRDQLSNPAIGYEVIFDLLNTEADGDSVIIEDSNGGRIKFSGNVLPPVLLVPGYYFRVTFKSDNDANVGTGFQLRWRRVSVDGGAGTFGNALQFDVTRGALVGGLHGVGTIQQAGVWSTNLGLQNSASGSAAIAMGTQNVVSGVVAVALGSNNLISGYGAIGFGVNHNVRGSFATALGHNNVASGAYSTAMGGYMSTSGFEGSFALGDHSVINNTTNSTAANQFTARFAGGYQLFTSSTATGGVQLTPNATAWSTLSDSTKKERFLPIYHADLLTKIRTLRLGTWNYKGLRGERHYGPMAQDFFARFGHDALGVIGCDTLLNSHDFTAVALSGVQALAMENEQLKARLVQLEQERTQTIARLDALERRLFIQPALQASSVTKRKRSR